MKIEPYRLGLQKTEWAAWPQVFGGGRAFILCSLFCALALSVAPKAAAEGVAATSVHDGNSVSSVLGNPTSGCSASEDTDASCVAETTAVVVNATLECTAGTYGLEAPQGGQMQIPAGWQVAFLDGTPWLNSAHMQYNGGSCGGGGHVEKIEGQDSLAVFAHDLEWSDRPGKPFDVAVYQQVAVQPGTVYSLSAWMVSLCGGSTTPNDCPDGHYMAKMLGIDPTGGTDPSAETVIWTEDRRNFIEDGKRVGWTNLRVGAVAESPTITLFGRVSSPFQWHGNHAFIDAFSLVEAPTASIDEVSEADEGHEIAVRWHGIQSEQIESIPGGVYELVFDLQYKAGRDGNWTDWLTGRSAGAASFTAQVSPLQFRVRARAVQPPGDYGAWPNHRYPGVWSDPREVTLTEQAEPPRHTLFVPTISR